IDCAWPFSSFRHHSKGNVMTAYGKSTCPACGAGNGPAAPFCAACGKTLIRPGFAARPADDDEDDDEPRRPVRKPAAAAGRKGAPPPKKNPAARPVDDEEEEEERKPAKKKPARRDQEPEEETESARDSTALNLLAPVGGSLWGLAALIFGG